jgi:glycosyltransferase involved in cell wall biosynthesis
MLTIGFDARWLGAHGIGRYAAEVSVRCAMRPLVISGKPLSLWDPIRLGIAVAQQKPGHFFSPGFNSPLGSSCPFYLTIHDLIHLEVSDEASLAKRAYYQWVVKPATRNAEVIFTVSEHSRQRIAEWSGVDEQKIIVAGNGVSSHFSPVGEVWPHPRPYLLYVGNQKPHKNVRGMIRAFADSGLASDYDLLLSGDVSDSMAMLAAQLSVPDSVHGLGLVEEADLPSVYRGATALIMPSRYEGFGLPLVEAMACGTPVLSSNRTSLPEIGGDAVRYFDPDDEESFIEGLRALRENGLRSDLRARGLERTKIFDWDQVAERIRQGIGLEQT